MLSFRASVILTIAGFGLAPVVGAGVAMFSGSGCSSSSAPPGATTDVDGRVRTVIVLNGQNEDLVAYDATDPSRKQVLISGGETEKIPGPSSVNGEICFDPSHPGWFAMADDNLNPNPPNHFSVFQLGGTEIGSLTINKLSNLIPTYQKETSGFGCHFMKDGRLLTTDEGNLDTGPGNGQLVMWFPPLDSPTAHYCKLDITIGTAGQIHVDDQERIYVASARLEPGIYRYPGPFPTGDDAAHGCGGKDSTGAPMVENLPRERFILGDQNIVTPTGIAASPQGTLYISSVLNGVIAEYDANGKFLRKVLEPPRGETLAKSPYSTGTPYGITVASDGTLYFADIGISLQSAGSVDIANGSGSLRRITFDNGTPRAPEMLDKGLSFPDGVAVVEF